MRFVENLPYIPLIAVLALSACASKPPVAYVQKNKPEPISQKFEGNFCVTQNSFITGGAGITKTMPAYHQAVGKCFYNKLNMDEMNVINFDAAQDAINRDSMYAELENSLRPVEVAAVVQNPAEQAEKTDSAVVAANDCESEDCVELGMLEKGFQLHFASDSDVPTNVGEVLVLEKLAAVAKKHSIKLSVTGHADSSSTEAHNTSLSVRRAEAVARTLKTDGLGEDMMLVAGHSSNEPLASNDEPEGRAANRRCEVKKLAQKEEVAGGN